jgi:hypothetical protein
METVMKKRPLLLSVCILCAVLAITFAFLRSGNRQTANEGNHPVPIPGSAGPAQPEVLSKGMPKPAAPEDLPPPQPRTVSLPSDWSSALEAIAAETNPELREKLVLDLLKKLGGGDIAQVISWLSQVEPTAVIVEVEKRLLRQWAEKNPGDAARVALEMAGDNQKEALKGVLIVWANANPTAALAWVDQLPDGPLKQSAEITVGYEAARTDPEAALEHAAGMPPGAERDDLLGYAAAQWSASSPKAAADWVAMMDEGPLRTRLAATVATAWGESDPVAADAFAQSNLPEGRLLSDTLVGIAQRWVQTDPQAASAWVNSLPEGELRNAAIENIVKLWADKNPAQAGAWLNTLPATPSRDSGIRAYSEQIAPAYPGSAMTWAGLISNPQIRQSQIGAIANLKKTTGR